MSIFSFFNQVIFSGIISLTIHNSNAFFQFSIFCKVVKSSWIISLFINASDILLSMLFNLLLASITAILLCFFYLFLAVFNSFFAMSLVIENTRLQLALIIPAGASITVANDAIKMLLVVTYKKKMTYQNSQKKRYIY